MNNYQLFSTLPEIAILDQLENVYPIKGFRENIVFFSKYTFESEKTVDKVKEFIPELDKYYMNCKKKVFLENITFKKSLTILRQILRIFGYKVMHKEKFVNYRKFYLYWIVYDDKLKKEDDDRFNRSKKHIVYFD